MITTYYKLQHPAVVNYDKKRIKNIIIYMAETNLWIIIYIVNIMIRTGTA